MVLFARNRLCALVKPGLKADSATLLERMLEPAVKLGISTPKADPSGDYAFEVFGKADAIKPGARAVLEVVYRWFEEGRQTADLVAARTLLAEMR